MTKEKLLKLKTPCYIIDQSKFMENCNEIEMSFKNYWGDNIIFGYSIKTNHHKELMGMANSRRWYAEAVSEKEYQLARKLGFSSNHIIYNGPVKGEGLQEALINGSIVNLDNWEEVDKVLSYGFKEAITIGVRVNFDLEKYCPGETTAGEQANRFGFCYENGDLGKVIDILNRSKIKVDGLHMHVSTKTRSCKVFREIAQIVCRIKKEYGLTLKYIDIGGGFFGGQIVAGKPTMQEYAKTICSVLCQEFDPQITTLILEPGASIIATAVQYLTKVVSVKRVRDEMIVTLDGSLLHINPFMVDRRPKYEMIGELGQIEEVQQICGSTCMEADRFMSLRKSNRVNSNMLFLFYEAGAYTMCMNNYFIHTPPQVYVYKGADYVYCDED